jgi:hypothetical protein
METVHVDHDERLPQLDPAVPALYERGKEARLAGGFSSGPLELERTKELIETGTAAMAAASVLRLFAHRQPPAPGWLGQSRGRSRADAPFTGE